MSGDCCGVSSWCLSVEMRACRCLKLLVCDCKCDVVGLWELVGLCCVCGGGVCSAGCSSRLCDEPCCWSVCVRMLLVL